MDPITIGFGLFSLYGAVSKYGSQQQAEQERQEALQMRIMQQKNVSAYQAIARGKALHSVMEEQQARGAAQGMAGGSQSSLAIANKSFQNFAQDNQIAAMNLQGEIYQDQLGISASQNQLSNDKMSDIMGAGTDLLNLYGGFGATSKAAPKTNSNTFSSNYSSSGGMMPFLNEWRESSGSGLA